MATSSNREGAKSLTPVLVITTDKKNSNLDIASEFLSLVSFAEAQNKKKCMPKPRPAVFYEFATEDAGFKMPPFEAKLCNVVMKDTSGNLLPKNTAAGMTLSKASDVSSQGIQTRARDSEDALRLLSTESDIDSDPDYFLPKLSPFDQSVTSSGHFLSPITTTSPCSIESKSVQLSNKDAKDYAADFARKSLDNFSMFSEREENSNTERSEKDIGKKDCVYFDFQLPPDFATTAECFYMDAAPQRMWGQPMAEQPFFPDLPSFGPPASPFAIPPNPFMPPQASYLSEPPPFLPPSLFSYCLDPFATPMYWSAPFDGCPAGGDKKMAIITDVEDNNGNFTEVTRTTANHDINVSDCSRNTSYETCVSNLDLSEPATKHSINKDTVLKLNRKQSPTSLTSEKAMQTTPLPSNLHDSSDTKPKQRLNKLITNSAPESKLPKLLGGGSKSNKSIADNSWSHTLRSISENIAFQKLRQPSTESNSRKHAQSYTNKSYIMKAILSLFQEPKSSQTLSEAFSSENGNLINSPSTIVNYIVRERLKKILSEILIERAELQLQSKSKPATTNPVHFRQRQNMPYNPPLSPVEEQDAFCHETSDMVFLPMESNDNRDNCLCFENESYNGDTSDYVPNVCLQEVHSQSVNTSLQSSECSCCQVDYRSNRNTSFECNCRSSHIPLDSFRSSSKHTTPFSSGRLSTKAWCCDSDDNIGSVHLCCNCSQISNISDLPPLYCSCGNVNCTKFCEWTSDELATDSSGPSNDSPVYEIEHTRSAFSISESTKKKLHRYGDIHNDHDMTINANYDTRNSRHLLPYDFVDHSGVSLRGNLHNDARDLYGSSSILLDGDGNLPRACCSGTELRLSQWEPNAVNTSYLSPCIISYMARPDLTASSGDIMSTKNCSCTNVSLGSSSSSWQSHY